MVARDIMKTDVVTIEAGESVRRAGEIMLDTGYAALPVVSPEGAILGLLTESDILGLAIPEYLSNTDLSFMPKKDRFPGPESVDLDSVTVGQAMRRAILRTVGPDEPVIEVAQIMVREHVRRCPVVENGKLVGIISRRDLMEIIVRPAVDGT
ncbi:MAG: CBS domain-containing protein [Armatimonadetes bacterium]|nr:CBS domain-containing protein [Armatimonadota bacterium]